MQEPTSENDLLLQNQILQGKMKTEKENFNRKYRYFGNIYII